jgi:esterase/lipase superfamily enzyme
MRAVATLIIDQIAPALLIFAVNEAVCLLSDLTVLIQILDNSASIVPAVLHVLNFRNHDFTSWWIFCTFRMNALLS